MIRLGFGKIGRRALFAAAVAGFAVPVAAQENEAAQPDSGVDSATEPPVAEKVAQRDTLRPYQIRASETEYLPARFRVADAREGELRAAGTTGVLVIQNGRIVARGETDIGGVAQVRNLRPGGYSVIAIGPDGMAVFGVAVLPPAPGVGLTHVHKIDAMLVPPADMAVAQQLIAGAMAPPAAGIAPPAAARPALPPIPASLKAENQEKVRVAAATLEEDFGGGAEPISEVDAADPVLGETVVVPPDGRIVNHFVTLDAAGTPSPFANSRVFFLRDGQLLGEIETNGEGYCAATGVSDGVYSLVGIGPPGFFAFAARLESVTAAATAGAPPVATTYVSVLQGGVPTVNLSAAAAGADALPFAPGFAGPGPFGPFGPGGPGMFPGGGGPFGGGGGGGMAGGGGGFGGGGLLGALLGAGLGAGLGAALGDDDDDGANVPPPQQSPFQTPGQGPPIIPPGQGGTPPGQDDDD